MLIPFMVTLWTFIRATPCRAGRWGQGDRDAWRQVAGEFTVVNEWLKQGQTTLFVERELGEALKRTDLPEGFSPARLALAMERFSFGPSFGPIPHVRPPPRRVGHGHPHRHRRKGAQGSVPRLPPD